MRAPEPKPKRGDLCPICKTERITLEFEVDAAKCVDCQCDESLFIQAQHKLQTIVAHV